MFSYNHKNRNNNENENVNASRILSKSFEISNSVCRYFFFLSFFYHSLRSLLCMCFYFVPSLAKWVVLRCIKSDYRKLTRPLLCTIAQLHRNVSLFILFIFLYFLYGNGASSLYVPHHTIFNFVNLYLLIKALAKVKASKRITTRNQNMYSGSAVRVASFPRSAHIKRLLHNSN